MKIQPIKDEKSYDLALKRVEKLMDAEPETPKGDELEVLVTLIEAYENRVHPINVPDPIEAIRFRMQQKGLNNRDLEKYIGGSGRVSEIMNYKRRLSISMIRNLNVGLNIPLDSLIQEYKLRA